MYMSLNIPLNRYKTITIPQVFRRGERRRSHRRRLLGLRLPLLINVLSVLSLVASGGIVQGPFPKPPNLCPPNLSYTRSPLEDSRLFGPSPWKILATTYKKRISEQPCPWRKSSKRESCYGDRV